MYKTKPDRVNGQDAASAACLTKNNGDHSISHEVPSAKTWCLCKVIRKTGLDHFDLPSRMFEEHSQT